VMVLPSDHFISDESSFRQTLLVAVEASKSWPIVTIGITPTRPETGYGYLEKGDRAEGDVFAVARFVEKPDRARAESFVTSGRYLWNSGMFFFRVGEMRALLDLHMPELARGLDRIDGASSGADPSAEVEKVFPTLPAVSIDHGIMEKATQVAAVVGSFGWSDVGSWQSSWELAEKDPDGNAAPESTVLVEARGNLVRDLRTGDKGSVIALVGVDDLAVVVTDDALLVIPRGRSQDVKKVLEALKMRGR